MNLTLNEMRALKRFAEDALMDKNHVARIDKCAGVKERWAVLRDYLKSQHVGLGCSADDWNFRAGEAEALACRLNDLIGDEERHQRDASRMAHASWLSAGAAAVSAFAAFAALLSRFL